MKKIIVMLMLSVMSTGALAADVNVGINIDPLAIGNAIAQSINSSQNRAANVKIALQTAIHQTGGQYSVMVFNMRQNYDFWIDQADVKLFRNLVIDGTPFGVWVFTMGKGQFNNYGYAGWENWGFYGHTRREGPEGRWVYFN